MEAKKFYEKTWFVVLMLIFVFPVGVFLMWGCTSWNKVVKIIITALIALSLIFALVGGSGDDSTSTSDKPKTEQEQVVDDQKAEQEPTKEEKQEEPTIEYAAVTTDELSDALEANAVNASDTYKDKYFAVTGRLATIDASGKYISLVDIDDQLSFHVIQCYIKSDEQLERVKQLSKDDTVTVRGKITDVGELMGYSMNIDSID